MPSERADAREGADGLGNIWASFGVDLDENRRKLVEQCVFLSEEKSVERQPLNARVQSRVRFPDKKKKKKNETSARQRPSLFFLHRGSERKLASE